MKADIIGSGFTKKLTELKNFRFDVNHMMINQSMPAFLSKPYEVTMKEIDTTDLNEITVAYRDLNKSLYPNLKNSDADIMLVELLGELNGISRFEGALYNTSSLELLYDQVSHTRLSNIEKFRAFQKHLDEFEALLNQYDKVIFLKLLPTDEEDRAFIQGLYKMVESRIEHKLSLSIDYEMQKEKENIPLEIYNQVNDDLRKFSSDNYHNQLLFEEALEEDELSVYINYVEEREYFYELYKDGKPYKSSRPTTSRYQAFKLSEPGKYRIRVNLTNNEINPRFSQTYEFHPETPSVVSLEEYKYVEMPPEKDLWMLDIILQKENITGLVGDAYQHPDGYLQYPVLLEEEIDGPYLCKSDLFETALLMVSEMNRPAFEDFMEKYGELQNKKPMIYEFQSFVNKKTE